METYRSVHFSSASTLKRWEADPPVKRSTKSMMGTLSITSLQQCGRLPCGNVAELLEDTKESEVR